MSKQKSSRSIPRVVSNEDTLSHSLALDCHRNNATPTTSSSISYNVNESWQEQNCFDSEKQHGATVIDKEKQIIFHPGPNDILCGRGSAINSHIGNKKFRTFLNKYQEQYLKSSKADKSYIALQLVLYIQTQATPRGRFLMRVPKSELPQSYDEDSECWYEIDAIQASKKVAQRLREGKKVVSSSSLAVATAAAMIKKKIPTPSSATECNSTVNKCAMDNQFQSNFSGPNNSTSPRVESAMIRTAITSNTNAILGGALTPPNTTRCHTNVFPAVNQENWYHKLGRAIEGSNAIFSIQSPTMHFPSSTNHQAGTSPPLSLLTSMIGGGRNTEQGSSPPPRPVSGILGSNYVDYNHLNDSSCPPPASSIIPDGDEDGEFMTSFPVISAEVFEQQESSQYVHEQQIGQCQVLDYPTRSTNQIDSPATTNTRGATTNVSDDGSTSAMIINNGHQKEEVYPRGVKNNDAVPCCTPSYNYHNHFLISNSSSSSEEREQKSQHEETHHGSFFFDDVAACSTTILGISTTSSSSQHVHQESVFPSVPTTSTRTYKDGEDTSTREVGQQYYQQELENNLEFFGDLSSSTSPPTAAELLLRDLFD